VHARESLGAGARLHGPAVIDEADSTVLLRPGWRAEVHASGSLLLRRELGDRR
jgi:N-methylhydantoinase A/oxoprolinase/acetone carboxylase beta subunit